MRRSRFVIAVVLALSAFASTSWAQSATASRFVTGQILVKFKPGAAADAKAETHRRNGGRQLTEIRRTGVQLVSIPAGTEAVAIARYRNNPNVLYAEPNYIRSLPVPAGTAAAPVVPGDHNFQEQWGLHNTGQEFVCIPWIFGNLCLYVGTPDADIDAPEAWATSTGSPNVTVAVIDSGVDYTHPDLAPNYAGGYDFLNGDPDPMDDLGHGTHVAGIIAAAMNNATGDPAAAEGVVGVAPNTRILAYKVCGADGSCSDFAIEQAIAQAVADHARVINMSFGGPEYSQSMDEALQSAWTAGLVLVAAAGNNGTDALTYPASLPNVVSVGAFDEDDNRASFSTFGNWVDIAAPGNVIMSTYPMAQCPASTDPGDTGCYTWLSGTSMASPFVAGAAALVWSRGDVTSNQQVVDILLNSADPVGVGPTPLNAWTAHGGLNLANALAYTVTNLPPVANAGLDQNITDTNFDGVELVTLDGSGSSDSDGTIVSYDWKENDTLVATGANTSLWLTTGTHTLTLKVTDNAGDSGADDVVITVTTPNRPPVVSDTSASTLTGTPVTIALAGTDIETCELAFSVVQAPGSGSLGPMQDQACTAGIPNSDSAHVTYTPGSAGTYAFTFKANDGSDDSNVGTVTVVVTEPNRPPTASNATVSTLAGTPVTIALGAADIETCDLAFSIVQMPGSGTLGAIQNQPCVAGSPNIDAASITYTPADAGTFTFTFKANDGSDDSNIATATITVAAPPPPPPAPLTVTGISPNVVSQNVGTRSFVIAGSGFDSGARVAFVNGTAGQTPRVISVTHNSSTQLTATVQIRSGGPKKNRLWDVQVTNPDGTTAVGARLLTITP